MKLALTVAAGVFAIGATAADAQITVAARDVPPGHRPPPGMCRIWIDGVPPGRQPRPTDCATARARAPHNSRIIYGDRTPFPGQGRTSRGSRDCEYERSQTTLGDIIFGRSSGSGDVDCRYDDRRDYGSWYEVGRDRDGVVYQRRVRLEDGTVVVQRARRGRNGQMVVIDTRYPRSGISLDGRRDDDIWHSSDRDRSRTVRRGSNDRSGVWVADDRRGNSKGKKSKHKRNGRGRN